MPLNVHVVVQGVASGDEDYLERLMDGLRGVGAIDPAVVYYPQDNELGMCFDIEEEVLGGILEPEGDRAVA